MVTFAHLKRLENETLTAIRTQGPFGHLSSLSSAAHQAQIVTHGKVPIDVNLGFTLPTRLREDPGTEAIQRTFHVGCNAVASAQDDGISQLSYSVLIGKDAHPSRDVARKFHFDFEPAVSRNQKEPKPTFHLQMCGKLSPHHHTDGYSDGHIEHLLPAWSQPRIPTQPMSLALVLNWLFIEFGHEQSVRDARLNPRWRSLVREAERAVLKPYYEACFTFLSEAAHEEDSFYSRHIYEES